MLLHGVGWHGKRLAYMQANNAVMRVGVHEPANMPEMWQRGAGKGRAVPALQRQPAVPGTEQYAIEQKVQVSCGFCPCRRRLHYHGPVAAALTTAAVNSPI